MRKRTWAAGIAVLMLLLMCCTPALALEESEVESAIAASSNEAVAGNIFIWFLCAVAFLKISQKIDSFLAALGINVGRTGGSMLGELLIAGRAVGSAVGGLGGAVGNIFNRNHTSGSSTTHQAAGQAFSGSGGGLLAVAKRAAGNAAASSATGTAGGVGSVIGGAMFGSSMASGGKFANSVIGAVATGDISSVGSIKGEKAAQALTSYLGYSGAPVGAGDPVSTAAGAVVGNEVVSAMDGEDQDNSIVGLAHMDFFSSDMRYVKSLNGISEMKQYQLREMLKKLYSIYSVKNHRNLLVAPDSFAYLFEDSDLENRTKSGFILLAKDLKNKYGIPILIVRPKAMLTKNYVNVPPEIEQEFLAAFGNYATPLGFVSDRVEASRNPSRGSDIRIRNHGKIYSVQMGELWENHFANYYFWNEPRHAYYFP